MRRAEEMQLWTMEQLWQRHHLTSQTVDAAYVFVNPSLHDNHRECKTMQVVLSHDNSIIVSNGQHE